MTNTTPRYNPGDRVQIPHRNNEGEIVERWYSDTNESWVYRVAMGGPVQMGIYQEKNLTQ
jgi:hypothetical protein